MIKFQELLQLEDLELKVKEFYNRLNTDLIIKDLKGIKSNYTTLEGKLIDYLIENLEKIIKADPDSLLDFSKTIETRWPSIVTNNQNFKKGLLEAFGYEKRFRKNKGGGIKLGKVIGVKSCPYCDSQYTLSIYSETKEKLLYQFDHFFPKSIYPYFSVSFYNLIPSCASCNQGKSSTSITDLKDYYHPYVNDLHSRAKFELNINALDVVRNNSTLKEIEEKAKIQFVGRTSKDQQLVDNHNKFFHLNELYVNHIDEAAVIYSKARQENTDYQKGISAIEDLFEKGDAYRFIVGSYLDKGDFHKRPLSKMKFDIAEQLGLIN